MIKKSSIVLLTLVGLAWACGPNTSEESVEVLEEEVVVADNTLTEEEKAEGWFLLFDGTSMEGWRAFNGDSTPSNWIIEDGAMKGLGATGGEDFGGDIVFGPMEFEEFEMED